MKPIIAISMGDPGGIGPEIILKTLFETGTDSSVPVIFGNETVFRYYADILDQSVDLNVIKSAVEAEADKINLIDCTEFSKEDIKPGTLHAINGRAVMESIEAGIEACLSGEAKAIVTAPISKEAINLAGYNVPGHTEFLAEKTGTENVLMMLVSGSFRVALATIHIPLKDVPAQITADNLKKRLGILYDSLMNDFGIEKPSVACLGLNPHSGDGGVIGREEIEIIEPVVKELAESGLDVSGPFAADGFFGKRLQNNYDAVLATYHDQGLIPFKALTFGKGVNFTAGLPIIRTSPDHGTAFDIAGKNVADHSSFTAAYQLAVELNQNRN
ncbi:4-hydroxythreonine-4-phosphate dehydrogenase PdxA [soil metagenome]